MRIGIDCRLAGSRHAGIGRYIENLVTRLPLLAPGVEWTFFFHDQAQIDEVFGPKIPNNVTFVIASISHYSLSEQLKLPAIFYRARLDLLHVPHFNIAVGYRGRLVVTIHDLLWHEYRGAHVTTLSPVLYWLKYGMYRWIVKQAVSRSAAIMVPARTVHKTITKYYPFADHKIWVTKEGIDQRISSASSTQKTSSRSVAIAKHTTNNTQKNLLYIGSLYPHKNIKVVIQALSKLPEYHLTLIGSRTVFQDEIRRLVDAEKVSDQVTFAGYVPDDQLMKYYQQAFALVQPSLSEGFGLTGVEAMAAGVPVIASNIPIFNEIYRDGVTYFTPTSSDSFSKAVAKVAAANRQKLTAHAQKIVKEYSWDNMAAQTVQIYHRALEKKQK